MQPSRTQRFVALAFLGSVLGLGAIGLSAASAYAQDRARGRAEEAPADEPTADEEEAPAAETDVVEGDDGKVKVFKFSGLDISGRLKSPQLLYFLNRLRAEFNRPKLPHRSFIPELVRSSTEDSF